MENKKQLAGAVPVSYNIIATCKNADGSVAWKDEKKNLIAKVGRSVFAALLAHDTTNSGAIEWGALGDDTTAPAAGDIALGNETIRRAPFSYGQGAGDNTNKAYITFIFAADEAIGTHKEFGTFIDGSSAVDSGVLFSHVAVDWVKTDQQSLTIDVIYTIS